MSRQTSVQRWSNLVLLATLISLVLFYTLPAMVFRAGRAWEEGRGTAAIEKAKRVDEALRREQTESVRSVSSRVLPAVVRIEAIHESVPDSDGVKYVEHDLVPSNGPRTARSCGLVVARDGQVLTNYAVVAGAREIRVHVPRHPEVRSARFVGGDPDTDLAVLRIEPAVDDLSVAELNEQELPGAGDRVIAIGSADQVNHSLWVGTVHSEGRNAPAAGCLPQDFIQTAVVNSWNAGGPLLNARGEIVGINSTFSAVADTPTGMVVPATIAMQVVALLREKGCVERGWLGVFLHRIDRPLPSEIGGAAYALDYVVPESPAGRAGLRAGDWIVRVSGRTFPSASELRRWIAVTSPQTTLAISLIRNDSEIEQPVVIGQRPLSPPRLPGEAEWGVRVLSHLSPEERREAGLELSDGVVVQAVSAAARTADLKPGDAIVEVNGTPTRCLDDFCREVRRWRESSRVGAAQLTVESRGTKRYVEIARPDVARRSSSR